jgi:mannose-binding lectin 2
LILSPLSKLDSKSKKTIFGGSSSPSSTEESSSWLGFLFKLVLFVGLVGGGLYGWNEYQRRKRNSGFGSGNFGGGGVGGGMLGVGGPGRFGGAYASDKRF